MKFYYLPIEKPTPRNIRIDDKPEDNAAEIASACARLFQLSQQEHEEAVFALRENRPRAVVACT